MKAKLISISAAVCFILFVISCKKETAGAKISLSLKSVNATTFAQGQTVKFTFDFIPKTVKSDTLFIARKFYTCSFVAKDTSIFEFPEFDNNIKGELIYSFQYGSGGPYNGCLNPANGVSKTDSLNYYFWVKDKDGNVSDTVVSPKIILSK